MRTPEGPKIPLPDNEAERLADLESLGLLHSAREAAFDGLVRLAISLCGTPIAAVSLIDADRQWFKASIGIETESTKREHAVCAYTICGKDLFVVPDLSADPRFRNLPVVVGPPHLRFYAGHPILSANGNAIGTLCIASPDLLEITEAQLQHLVLLSQQAGALIELHRVTNTLRALGPPPPVPATTRNVFTDFGRELRTSMAGIVGLAELLAAGPLPPRERDYAATIARSGRALVTAFSQAASASGQHQVLLSEAVSSVFPQLKANALARGIRLTYELSPTINLGLEVNAHEFRTGIGRRVEVLLGAAGATQVQAEISSNNTDLTICLRSDGVLSGSSLGAEWRQSNRQIECRFQMPLVRPRETKVLVVEDNEVNSLVLSSMLSDLGCQVTSVTSAHEALRTFESEPFSMVLTDIQMPEMDGMELARTIREHEHDRHTPVIAVTASALADEMRTYRECGIDDAVQKPFSEQDIADIVARWANIA